MGSPRRLRLPTVLAAASAFFCVAAEAQTSSLWGTNGELWDPAGRLSDFSFAGYRASEVPIPDRSGSRVDVRSYGAFANDGNDDTAAFQAAIDAAQPGQAVWAPAGTYDFDGMLTIKKGRISLAGDGPGSSVLFFHRSLTEISRSPVSSGIAYPIDDPDCVSVDPPPSVAGESWSFVGGLLWIEGQDPIDGTTRLGEVVEPALRGDRTLALSSTSGIAVGMWIRLTETDPPRTGADSGSLVRYLHGDLANGGCEQAGRMLVSFHSRVSAIDGTRVTLERPLPVDVRAAWQPEIHRFAPTVEDVGVEDLTLQFPETAYPGEFNEAGFNGIYLHHAVNSWIRNVDIVNSDSGVFLRWSDFNTLDRVRIASTNGRRCHHAFNLPFLANDNLFTRFDIAQPCIHDLSVEQYSSGNVFSQGTGADVCLDHHRAAPYMNLFSDLDLGAGSRPYQTGGGAFSLRGPQTARYSTLWNIRAAGTVGVPACDFGPQMTFVGVSGAPAGACAGMDWFVEGIAPSALVPQDLHAAQLARRAACRQGAVTQCADGDGCCPTGCTPISDRDCASPSCLTGSTGWQNRPLPSQSGVFTVTFDARPNDGAMDGLVMLSSGAGATWSDYAAIVRFNNSGFLDARDGGAYGPGVVPYLAGITYRLRMTVDVAAHRYGVEVTLPGGAVEQVASNYAFRTEQAGISQIDHWAVQANAGSHAVCLVEVSAGAGDKRPASPGRVTVQ